MSIKFICCSDTETNIIADFTYSRYCRSRFRCSAGCKHFWHNSFLGETRHSNTTFCIRVSAGSSSSIPDPFSSSCHNDLPASATDLADGNASAPSFLELCEAFTQGQTVSLEIADYIHATTKDQGMYICTLVGPTEMDVSSALSLVRYLISTRRPIQTH